MPSMRRMRVFGGIVLVIVIYILYITSGSRQAQSPDFYSRTKDALDLNKNSYHPHNLPPSRGSKSEEEEDLAIAMSIRLKDAEKVAKDNANDKAPTRESVMGSEKPKAVVEDIGHEKTLPQDRNVAGRKKYPIENGSEKQKIADESEEDHNVEEELNSILKKSPIIIFSKSYCPHSRRAKGILLDKYLIVPAPYVVELDQHPLGPLLQARLAQMTGRSTVPNVLINGKSIGGGDDVAELDVRRTLISTVQKMGGKRMQEVVERPEAGS